jgi:hypothetical protein
LVRSRPAGFPIDIDHFELILSGKFRFTNVLYILDSTKRTRTGTGDVEAELMRTGPVKPPAR